MNNRVTNHQHMTPPLIPQQHDDTDDQTTTQKSDYDRFWELLYTSDCDNPIVQTLCQTGIELLTAAKQQRQTCDLLLVQHMTLETTPPPQKKARVEQMIKLAKTMGQTDFSITDIRRFYDILAPQDTTDTIRRYRRRKRPAPPPAKHRHEDHQLQQQTEESHGGEN